jgi:hypothetical protein
MAKMSESFKAHAKRQARKDAKGFFVFKLSFFAA